MEKLFSEFQPVSAAEWKQQITKDLKGESFEKLIWKNRNGFDVQPFYTEENLDGKPAPVFKRSGWDITEEIVVQDEKIANEKALRALNHGASSLHFILTKKVNLTALLHEISIEHIEVCFILRYFDLDFRTRLYSYAEHRNIDPVNLRGNICFDAIGQLAETGKWQVSEEKDFSWQNSWINAWLYQNAGATQSFELACTLAHAHEYLMRMGGSRRFRFSISIGSDFFGEIAKLRALRKLWPLIANEYKGDPQIEIHACNSHLNQSAMDAYNNMLRSTTEGMSAVIGGCDSLTIESYNKTFERTSKFSERIARNQQLIFREESYLDKVADISAGSYYVETLTDTIASQAWDFFRGIEERGGFLACLRSGFIQTTIKHQAEHLISKFREEKVVLVGVNKFQNKSEGVKQRPNIKRISTGAEVDPISKLCLSDYLVKENA